MLTFESNTKRIPHKQAAVYALLSDLSNVERMRKHVPLSTKGEFVATADNCEIELPPDKKIRLKVVERTPIECVKLATIYLTIPVYFRICLEADGESTTKMKINMEVNAEPYVKPLINNQALKTLNRIADVIAILPFE